MPLRRAAHGVPPEAVTDATVRVAAPARPPEASRLCMRLLATASTVAQCRQCLSQHRVRNAAGARRHGGASGGGRFCLRAVCRVKIGRWTMVKY